MDGAWDSKFLITYRDFKSLFCIPDTNITLYN